MNSSSTWTCCNCRVTRFPKSIKKLMFPPLSQRDWSVWVQICRFNLKFNIWKPATEQKKAKTSGLSWIFSLSEAIFPSKWQGSALKCPNVKQGPNFALTQLVLYLSSCFSRFWRKIPNCSRTPACPIWVVYFSTFSTFHRFSLLFWCHFSCWSIWQYSFSREKPFSPSKMFFFQILKIHGGSKNQNV